MATHRTTSRAEERRDPDADDSMSSTQRPTSEPRRARPVPVADARDGRWEVTPAGGVVPHVRLAPEVGEQPFPLILERRARVALRTHVTRSLVRASTLV